VYTKFGDLGFGFPFVTHDGYNLDENPVRNFEALYAPNQTDPSAKWYKAFDRFIYGMVWTGSGWNREEVTNENGDTYKVFQSYIVANQEVRLVGQLEWGGDKYVGEVYTKAPVPFADTATGAVKNINIFANISLGKLNLDVYASRLYERGSQIVSMTLPFKGIASVNDRSLSLHTGTAMWNGDKSPDGAYTLGGKVTLKYRRWNNYYF